MTRSTRPTLRAEPPEDIDFPRAPSTYTDGADGAWWCCTCSHENRIIHYSGNHPFHNMDCGKCERVMCRKCITTDIIEILPVNVPKMLDMPTFTVRNSIVRYASICPACGQSHRAKPIRDGLFTSEASKIVFLLDCKCGDSNESTESISLPWLRLRIGSNEDWRRSSAECYMLAVNKRIEKGLARYRQKNYMFRHMSAEIQKAWSSLEQQRGYTEPVLPTMQNLPRISVSQQCPRPKPRKARTDYTLECVYANEVA